MATSSLLGRRICLAAARVSQRQVLQTSSLRAASAVAASQQSYTRHDSTRFSSAKFGLLAAAGATLAATGAMNDQSNAKCCGIAGVVGGKGDARDYLIEGLTILKNRGYDSAGIATMAEDNPSLVSSAIDFIYSCMQMHRSYAIISNFYSHLYYFNHRL